MAAPPPPPAVPVDARGALLAPLLARNREKHPGPRLSNHFSMSLLSLAALGGTPKKIQALAEAKLRTLTPFPTGGPALTRERWRASLGDRDALPAYFALFTEEVTRHGPAETLRRYLPALLPGLGAHAFHAIIRTGYGVRFDEPAEVAMGLAYWSATFLPLGPLGAPGESSDPVAALAAVRATPGLTPEGQRRAGVGRPPGMNIADRMKWASSLPDFAPAASALRIDDRSLAAAYVSIGAPALVAPTAGAPPTWTEILARAASSRDDHQLKLTDIAREEARHYGDATYQRAAAIHLNLT